MKLGCHLNLKSDGAEFFPIVPFPRVFEPKGPKTGIFSFYENWTCVFFKKKIVRSYDNALKLLGKVFKVTIQA